MQHLAVQRDVSLAQIYREKKYHFCSYALQGSQRCTAVLLHPLAQPEDTTASRQECCSVKSRGLKIPLSEKAGKNGDRLAARHFARLGSTAISRWRASALTETRHGDTDTSVVYPAS